MKCPVCNHRLYVEEMTNKGLESRRTYQCPECMTRLQTRETFVKYLFKQEIVEEKKCET